MAKPVAARTAEVRGYEIPLDLLVDGEWVSSAERYPVVDPATGKVIAEMSSGDVSVAHRAIEAADNAQAGWSQLAPRARADLLHKAYSILVDRKNEFIEVMTAESGKPLSESRGEFALSAAFFLWFAEQAAHLHGTYSPSSNGAFRVVVGQKPVGPSYLVTPWNFPLLMSARKAGAALGAGCTVILKTARDTPLTQTLFAQVLQDAGFPKGVVNLIHTKNSGAISDAIISDPRVRKVSFTGSTNVGSTLLKQAAPGIKNASMELGGDGPFIVLPDADLEQAVNEAISCKFRNAGQACVAANRIILHEDISDEFTKRFVKKASELVTGNGFDEATDVGPLISESQQERTKEVIKKYVDAGANVLLGGSAIDGDGFFFEPTVIELGSERYDFCTDEIFAPIAALYTVKDVREAIEWANDTDYGLAAYIFTKNVSKAIALGEALDFGMVGINQGIMADPAAPFGGTKHSGIGREAGHDGIYEFLEPQYLALSIDEEEAYA